jgi:diguanylate cyclase (GGDEF)-like protein
LITTGHDGPRRATTGHDGPRRATTGHDGPRATGCGLRRPFAEDGEPAYIVLSAHVGPPAADKAPVRRLTVLRFSFAPAALGLLLAVLGTALVTSRASTGRAQLDRSLAITAGEKADLVDTELQRVQALALVTSRIPPFSELYADKGSQAAKIAAVAGPRREIDEALTYLWQLYPDRLVEAGYVDIDGAENARVVNGVPAPADSLLHDVRGWPSFRQGVSTPMGTARISAPFLSPTAHATVVAATVPVAPDGRRRAYVEVELATSALDRVLSSDLASGTGIAVIDQAGTRVAAAGRHVNAAKTLHTGLSTAGNKRYAVRPVPQAPDWFVVTAARPQSTLVVAAQPIQAAVLSLALVLLGLAVVGFRRSRAAAAEEFAAEHRGRADAEQRSRVDALTGLFNRRHTMETIEHELARGSSGPGVGVLMFDLDYFKLVNDRHGHIGGDAVLIEVAERLRTGAREWDIVARIGGEEFCVIAPGLDSEDDIAALGERLRLCVAERPVLLPNGAAVPVTISVGAALVAHGNGSAEHAIDFADRALYAAKRHGRNRMHRFSELDTTDRRAEQPECLHLAEALAISGDLREGSLSQHSRQVADLCAATARRLGLSEDDVLRVRLGGWLRDVGKVAVPDAILTKPGRLADDEWTIIRTHPAVGADLLRHFPELASACPGVRHHHERYDGTGYPDQLAGEDIPIDARIIAAADAFSAMTADRPYRTPKPIAEAIAELRRSVGTQLDPAVAAALIDELDATSSERTATPPERVIYT